MRDGRLIRRSYTLVDTTLVVSRISNGVQLASLGDRKRYRNFGDEAIEERASDKTQMYLR